jgi:hypothetical protein
MNQFFDTIGGLPLHPLTVHAASVLIPLSALALVLLVFVPKWRKAYLPLTVGALAVSVGLAFAAKQSGEALAARVGNPADHQELGDLLFPASIGLFALGLAFYFFTKTETKTPKWTLQLAGGLSTAAVAGVVILSVLVGHSGAEATWGNRLTANPVEELVAPTEPVPGATDGSTGGTTGGTSNGGITVAEVLKHNTATDCWSVVNGNVYDLTSLRLTTQRWRSSYQSHLWKRWNQVFLRSARWSYKTKRRSFISTSWSTCNLKFKWWDKFRIGNYRNHSRSWHNSCTNCSRSSEAQHRN